MHVDVLYHVEGGANENGNENHGNGNMESDTERSKQVERVSTRDWAEKNEYDPHKLFFKVGCVKNSDLKYSV